MDGLSSEPPFLWHSPVCRDARILIKKQGEKRKFSLRAFGYIFILNHRGMQRHRLHDPLSLACGFPVVCHTHTCRHTPLLLKPGLLVPGKGVRKQLWTDVGGHILLPLGGDTSTTPPQVSSEPHPRPGPVYPGGQEGWRRRCAGPL